SRVSCSARVRRKTSSSSTSSTRLRPAPVGFGAAGVDPVEFGPEDGRDMLFSSFLRQITFGPVTGKIAPLADRLWGVHHWPVQGAPYPALPRPGMPAKTPPPRASGGGLSTQGNPDLTIPRLVKKGWECLEIPAKSQ